MSDFPLVIRDGEQYILDFVDNGTMGYVTTLVVGQSGVNLILNEETGQLYIVTYNRRHHTHTFPTRPEITVVLTDFG